MAKFLLGNVVRLRVIITTDDNVTRVNVPFTAGTTTPAITLRVQPPNGITSVLPSAGIINLSVGVYDYDYLPTVEGIHRILWVTDGSIASSVEDSFIVTPLTVI